MTYQPSIEEIRHRRNVFLERSDIYVLPDRWDTYSLEERSNWSTYRHELRDLTSQSGFPNTINWPVSPVDLNVEKPEGWPDSWP
jgi:hypothetical protein